MRRARTGALVLTLVGCPSALQAHDPESDIRRRLDLAAQNGIHSPVANRELALPRLDLSEVTIRTAPIQIMFHVVASGTFGAARLGYYGSETLSAHDPVEVDLRLPRLQGVLQALVARDQALEAHDLTALGILAEPGYRDGALTTKDLPRELSTASWQGEPQSLSVRIDGDRATVTLTVVTDGGASLHALSLVRRAESWLFASGLL